MKIFNIYFSPRGSTERIAKYFSSKLETEDVDLCNSKLRFELNIEPDSISILSIPTYSQNIPIPLRDCLENIKSKYVIINITYGGMSYGNMVNETAKLLNNSTIIGYSITPVSHVYLDQNLAIDFSKYDALIERLIKKQFITVKTKFKMKNIFANFLEKERTLFNYKLSFNQDLCNNCHLCIDNCPTNSITEDHQFLSDCIQCSRCAANCPTRAITAKQSKPLKLYLKLKQKTNVIVR